MKKVIALFFLLGLCGFSQAQKLATHLNPGPKRAQMLYDRFSYASALEAFQQELEKLEAKPESDPKERLDMKLMMAKCYRKLNDPVNAAKFYAQVVHTQVATPQDQLHYAEALSQNGKYEEASQWFEAYNKAIPRDQRPDKFLTSIQNLDEFFRDSSRYKITHLEINSPQADFSPNFYGQGIIFASERTDAFHVNDKHSWHENTFLRLFYAPFQEGNTMKMQHPIPFDNKINTKFHEGPATFFDNETKIIFTRNNYYNKKLGKSGDDIVKLKLFYAEKDEEGNWGNIQSLPFNSDEYSVGHPTMNKEGTILYFSSDMPGGFGGVDLYKATLVSGKWSPPVNLGASVNSEGNEMFPFVLKDSLLFFASNGHGGLGGLDIFSTEITESGFGEIQNMGFPLNTERDDFGLVLRENLTGYFSSNREGGTGSDDLYGIKIDPAMTLITGLIELDQYKRGQRDTFPLEGANITVQNITDGTEEYNLLSSSEGRFQFLAKPGKKYVIAGKKGELEEETVELSIPKRGSKEPLNAYLKLEDIPVFYFEGTVFELAESGNAPLDSSGVFLFNTSTEEKTPFITSVEGKFGFVLMPGTTYLIKAVKHGYFSDCLQLIVPLEIEKDTVKSSLELKLRKITKDFVLNIDNLLYDLNKWDIRPDAALELDKMVSFLNEYEEIEIELGAHTDSRGSAKYNEYLSGMRAGAAVQYIISKGIDKSRVSSKGYGESQLINQCKDGVTCQEEEHQANRRTEIKITGIRDIKKEAYVVGGEAVVPENVFSDLSKFQDCKSHRVEVD